MISKTILKNTIFYKTYVHLKLQRELKIFTKKDKQMKDFYSIFITQGQLVFDVGANVGNRVKIFLSIGAKVVAFEPQPNCISIIQNVFGKNPNLYLEKVGVGSKPGHANLNISDVSTISSLSIDWIEAVKTSGRFSKYRWEKIQSIEITTLDEMILKYGIPSFIKIDVEGYELEVIKGLTVPINALSFEFTPEFKSDTLKIIDYIDNLATYEFNYAVGETMQFINNDWITAQEMKQIVANFQIDPNLNGDIYAREKVK